MGEQNSTVEQQIRPNVLQDQLGIKKDAYYAYLKHLGIKAEKDTKGKAFLTEPQANLVRELRKYVLNGGKIEDFQLPEQGPIKEVVEESAALAVAGGGELEQSAVENTASSAADESQGLDMELMYRQASEIAGQRLTSGTQVILAMANQMGYEDLHPEVKAQVDRVREAAAPKFNPQEVAANLLNKCKQRMQAQAA